MNKGNSARPSFVSQSSLGEKKQNHRGGLALGLVNPDSSTDRCPDRSNSDDGIGATDASDTHLSAGNSDSAGSPRDSNMAFLAGTPGRCRHGSPRLLLIGWVPGKSVRAMPNPRGKIFS
jgi:hypothetical protein